MSRVRALIIVLVSIAIAIVGWFFYTIGRLDGVESIPAEPFTALATPEGVTLTSVRSETLPHFRLGERREYRCEGDFLPVVSKFKRVNRSVKFIQEGDRICALTKWYHVCFEAASADGYVAIVVVMEI